MNLILSFFVFVLGLEIGSFLNVVIYRIHKKESFLKGRSYCPHCRHKLSWYDLVPILSFVFLRGKCRYCQKSISIQYPLIEIITGVLFLAMLKFSGINEFSLLSLQSFNLVYLLAIVSISIVIFVYDLKYLLISDGLIYSATGIVLLYRLINFQDFKISFLSAIGAMLFFLFIFLISKGRWLGFGDVKLVFFMGLFLSFPNVLVALFLSFLIGAIIGVAMIGFKKRTLKSEIPFGPFLITGTYLALFFGEKIVYWYMNLTFFL